MKKHFLFFMIAVATLISCDKDKDEVVNEGTSIIGTWELYSKTDKNGNIELISHTTDCPNTVTFLTNNKAKSRYYRSTTKPCESYIIIDFTYNISGNKITTYSENEKTYTHTILELTSSKLIIKDDDGTKTEFRKL